MSSNVLLFARKCLKVLRSCYNRAVEVGCNLLMEHTREIDMFHVCVLTEYSSQTVSAWI